MKILHVINSLAAGGAEKLVSELASAQSNLPENNVSVFTFNSSQDIFRSRLSANVNFRNTKSNSFYSLNNLQLLYKEIKNHDIIHVHLFPALYIVAFLSFLIPSKKITITEHSSYNRRRSKKLFKYIEKVVYSRFSTIICISSGVELTLKKWIGNKYKTILISNFIDIESISHTPILIESIFKPEDVKLVMVGSFSAAKDQRTVLKALKELPDQFKLLLIGDGPKRKEVEILALDLGLMERISFLGIRKDVIEILKTCDYGILSSHWEGFGIVALEYMATNIIALGTNVEGLNEVLPIKENLFTVGDYKGLSKRILAIEQNQESKDKILQLQKSILINYDLKKSVQLHQTTYLNILKVC